MFACNFCSAEQQSSVLIPAIHTLAVDYVLLTENIGRTEENIGYWARQGKLHFKHLRSVAQQAFGNQASAAQIERDFGGWGQLLSSRRSRLDGFYVEMLLFLHLNFDKIPVAVPAFTTASIPTFIPKRFTGADPELREANDFVDPLDPATPKDMKDDPDGLRAVEDGIQGVNGS